MKSLSGFSSSQQNLSVFAAIHHNFQLCCCLFNTLGWLWSTSHLESESSWMLCNIVCCTILVFSAMSGLVKGNSSRLECHNPSFHQNQEFHFLGSNQSILLHLHCDNPCQSGVKFLVEAVFPLCL